MRKSICPAHELFGHKLSSTIALRQFEGAYMSALILLSNYDKMKKNKSTAPHKEADIPVDMKTMRAFRTEMLSRISSTDARFDRLEAKVDGIVTEIKAMKAMNEAAIAAINTKVDSGIAEMKALFHQAFMMFEEQNLRNKQAYDSAAVSYEAVQDLKRRIKPECLDN